jgi:hypothetical protein
VPEPVEEKVVAPPPPPPPVAVKPAPPPPPAAKPAAPPPPPAFEQKRPENEVKQYEKPHWRDAHSGHVKPIPTVRRNPAGVTQEIELKQSAAKEFDLYKRINLYPSNTPLPKKQE